MFNRMSMDPYLNCHNRMEQRGEVTIRVIGKPAAGVQEYLVYRPIQSLLFQFTRHATSCFNIESYPDGDNLYGLAKSDGIPSLAKNGITETIELAKKNRTTLRFQSDNVCVSNLIRTWMTAVLLYAFPNRKRITLRICPHLRETGGKGNGAYALTKSIPKFRSFLELIRKPIMINGKDITLPYRGLREIILLLPQYPNNYSSWVRTIIDIPQDIHTKVKDVPSICDIFVSDDPLLEKGYTDEGDIRTFTEWYQKTFPEKQEKVHIVAHNHIMQEYFNKLCKSGMLSRKANFEDKCKEQKFNIKNYSVNDDTTMTGREIITQNCWTFTTPPYEKINMETLIKSIQTGYLNPGKGPEKSDAQRDERDDTSTKSLCRDNVVAIDCSKGGRRTKKRKSYRRKSRSTLRQRI